MASITRNHIYTVDLNKPLTRQSCGILLAEGDNNGDCFSFALVRDGVIAALDSTAVVSAYMIRQDGSTVPVNGTYAWNTAIVTLPKACYAQEGHFALAVKVSMSGAMTTVAVLDGFIKNVTTDTVVDPGAVVPSLDDLLAQIGAMEQATAGANAIINKLTIDTAQLANGDYMLVLNL